MTASPGITVSCAVMRRAPRTWRECVCAVTRTVGRVWQGRECRATLIERIARWIRERDRGEARRRELSRGVREGSRAQPGAPSGAARVGDSLVHAGPC